VRILFVVLAACLIVAGCTSPETERRRGYGPGADVGNRPATVKMHEGSDPFWKTPERITSGHAPVNTADQAEQLSRP
jgi:hypothetical protein